MPDIRKTKNNFTSGILSPSVWGRSDIEKYQSGCKQIINCTVKAHGGVSSRPGTLYVDDVDEPGRFIPFTYSVEQTYALLFMDYKMRIYKDGGVVVYPTGHINEGDIVEIVTPYAFADIKKFNKAQSADVMFIALVAEAEYPPYTLTRTDHHEWTFELMVFDPEIEAPSAPTVTPADFSGGNADTIDYKISAVSEDGEESYPSISARAVTVNPWNSGATVTISWPLETGVARYNVYKNNRGFYGWIGTINSEHFHQLTIDTQPTVGDTMTIGDKDFTFVTDGTEAIDGDITVGTNLATAQLAIVAAINGTDGINTASAFVTASAFATNLTKLSVVDNVTGSDVTMAETFTAATNIFSLEDLSMVDDFIEEDSGDGPKEPKNPFEGAGNYPGVVGIYQQRLIFGRTNNYPQTIWASQTGNLNNFTISYPLKDTDSIEAIADSLQMNEIRHFFPMKNNLILTSGAEIMMGPGRNSDGITPTGSLRFDIQSYWGASYVPPLVAGNNIISVQNSGSIVRDLYYSLADDGYIGSELTILCPDLFASPIIDWTYQNEPDHIVYACREDGKILMLTYIREQEVYAWSLMETLGEYISVVSIRNIKVDDVYFLVKRGEKYFIEYQKPTKIGTAREHHYFVDNGGVYDGVPTDEVTGLDWLAGRTDISVLADGSIYKNQTISAGGVLTLPEEFSVINIGEPYTSLVETLDPEITDNKGSMMGKSKIATKVTLHVLESAEIEIGYIHNNVERFSKLKYPQAETYDGMPPLVTGFIDTSLQNKHRKEATIAFKQTNPVQMNVLSVTTEINVGEK